MPKFYIYLPQKLTKFPNFTICAPQKINKMPEFYMIFARKIFFPEFFWGGGQVPFLLPHLLRLWTQLPDYCQIIE